jgi:spore photoproduct lyase
MTKSPNLTSLLKAQCDNRVLVTIGFNPQAVIDKYEHGTYSLKERIAAAKKVQKKGDINLKLEIEPIIFIPDYEKEYIKLIRKLLKELDVNKISKITMGGIRLAADYRGIIPQYFPDTDLLDMHMEKPDVSYDRYRYPLGERADLYSKLIDEIKKSL